MNQLNIIGNLTKDPTVRQVHGTRGDKNVANFTVAVNMKRNGQNEAVFVDCSAWSGLADVVAQYACKGMKVRVTGLVSLREYTSNNEKRCALQINTVEAFEMLNSPNKNEKPKQEPEVVDTPEDLPF